MDTRLFESAWTGNIDDLHKLLSENPLILHTISLHSSENPLHIGSAAGQIGFVREILRLRPDYAKEVNKDGFSPLHMAAANGHVELVREFLNIVGSNLCCVQGREKMTPLHVAAVKGRADVMSVMLLSCADCIECETITRETALHLAIKNCQFEAIEVMVDWIVRMNREDILNLKDEQGNTVLHLATWKKQRQVIELLLESGTTTSGMMEVNAINQSGLTALDILLIFPSEAGDREIAEILQQYGAMRARDIMMSPNPSGESHGEVTNRPEARAGIQQRCCQPRKKDKLVEYFKFKKGRDSPSEARSALLVIAVLVATATFQIGLNPPGGTWQETYVPNQNNGTSANSLYDEAHYAGESIMGTNSGVTFALFMIFNSIGFSVSLSMINILTSKFPLQFELQVSMVAMFFTYCTAMSIISPTGVKVLTIVITNVLASITPLLTKLAKQLLKLLRKLVMDVFHKVASAVCDT